VRSADELPIALARCEHAAEDRSERGALERLLALVGEHSGVDFGAYKRTTL
jgi:hypothetical protein